MLAKILQIDGKLINLKRNNRLLQSESINITEKLFYMYELDEEYWWRWPTDGADCSNNGYVGHEHKQYSGIGPPLIPENGLFLTWHFSLFSSLYNRMKRSSRRTRDPEKASLFIIPYDIGLDGYLHPKTCGNRRSCSNGLVGKLQAMLSESKYFRRYNGADHAVLWSLGQYHPWPRAGCDLFMRDFCAKCTFTCYWMDATKAENKFVSVPFPAAYHWWDGIQNLPWEIALAPHRNITVVYLGSIQTLNPTHTKIRRAMTAQCANSKQCHWLRIGHDSKDLSIGDYLSVYKKSVFCLCPPGDDPARKAVFDAIVSGCIPVIFEVGTLFNQYPWHIGEQNALDIAVHIPGGRVRSGSLDFMSVLLAIKPEVIHKKQLALAKIAPRVQYAIPPLESLLDRFDETPWDPPFPDGVELTLNGLFDRAEKMVNNKSTGIPERLMTGLEWGKEYDVVRVKVPKIDISELTEANGAILRRTNQSFSQGKIEDGVGMIPVHVIDQLQAELDGIVVDVKPQKGRPHKTFSFGKTNKLSGGKKGRNPGRTGKLTFSSTNSHFQSLRKQQTHSTYSFGSTTNYSAHKDKLFYMYDLGEEFWWRWPVNGSDCSGNGYVGHEHKQYSGIGPPLIPENGLFLTWHFSLFSSLYNRMKRSSRRTRDPEKASLFIIPYDMSLDGYLDPNTCRNRKQCSNGFIGKLREILSGSIYFQRHGGGDHAVLWSLGQYHPWPRAGCDLFIKDFCAKCTFTCYWMDPTKVDNQFVSVPFPAAYHWWDGIQNLPWDLSVASERNLTAVYLGSIQTLNPYHTKIRRAMTAQCNTSSECHWLKIEHTSKDMNIGDYLSVYKKSVFCLCPPGDDPGRKAVFDAIVSGCIPVIFEVATFFNQYPWHIGEQAALDVAVHVPGGRVRSGSLDFMSVLLAIRPEVIYKKQMALAKLAPRVQYAIPPLESLLDRFDETPWDPPFPDGVELTLNGLFDRAEKMVNNKSTGIPHRVLSGREWGREYDIVRVQVPNISLAALNPATGDVPIEFLNRNFTDFELMVDLMQDQMDRDIQGVITPGKGGIRHPSGGKMGGKKGRNPGIFERVSKGVGGLFERGVSRGKGQNSEDELKDPKDFRGGQIMHKYVKIDTAILGPGEAEHAEE